MKRSSIAIIASVIVLTFANTSTARKTYTFEEIQAMKKEGKLLGNERFVMIRGGEGRELVGTESDKTLFAPSEEAYLAPSGKKQESKVPVVSAPGEAAAIAYDKVTTTRYLTTMAREYYGNPDFWPYIYEENKAKLGDPDRTIPGTMVVVPDLKKYGVNPRNPAEIEKARRMGKEIYARYGKQY